MSDLDKKLKTIALEAPEECEATNALRRLQDRAGREEQVDG